MRLRMVIGVVLFLLGAVWFLQGINVLGGSGMSGQGFWAIAGIVVLAIGVKLLRSARRARAAGRP
jgi:hypothetical protein